MMRLGGLTAEEALAVERPATTLVRGQLGSRLGARWPAPTGGGGSRPAAGRATADG
jgi:hypothetical protein